MVRQKRVVQPAPTLLPTGERSKASLQVLQHPFLGTRTAEPHPVGAGFIYMLGNRAARLLAKLGITVPRIDWDQRAKEWQLYSFAHPLLVTRTNVCFAQ